MSDENQTPEQGTPVIEMGRTTLQLTALPEKEAAEEFVKNIVATAPKLPKLTAGRVVTYTPKVDSHQGLEGGIGYPAMVVRAFSDTCATLAVFTESANFPVHVITSVNHNPDGLLGTWRWPDCV